MIMTSSENRNWVFRKVSTVIKKAKKDFNNSLLIATPELMID